MSHDALTDPTTKYPQGDFPAQEQDQPGITDETTPTPDHGERTYHGSLRLSGRRALITGGDSGIGRAVAIAFAREGADVAISHLPEEQDDADDTVRWITEAGAKALTLPGDLRDEAYCAEIVERTVQEFGGHRSARAERGVPARPEGHREPRDRGVRPRLPHEPLRADLHRPCGGAAPRSRGPRSS